MPTPAAAPAETAIVSATERAVHPDFYGVKYDELYTEVAKNMQSTLSVWPKNKSKYEVAVAKAESNPLAAAVVANAKQLIAAIDKDYTCIQKKDTAIQVNGRGFLSKGELELAKDSCENIFKLNQKMLEMTKALQRLSGLAPVVLSQIIAGKAA